MSVPTLPNQRLPGAWIDSGDPNEYGVTVLPDYTDAPMNARHHYCGKADIACSVDIFCGGWRSFWS